MVSAAIFASARLDWEASARMCLTLSHYTIPPSALHCLGLMGILQNSEKPTSIVQRHSLMMDIVLQGAAHSRLACLVDQLLKSS